MVLEELICPECGKRFIKNESSIYKLKGRHGRTVYYCSYTCWRKNDKRGYHFAKGSYSHETKID